MRKQECNAEMWGKGVCDIWEKWVSGWRSALNELPPASKKSSVAPSGMSSCARIAARSTPCKHKDARCHLEEKTWAWHLGKKRGVVRLASERRALGSLDPTMSDPSVVVGSPFWAVSPFSA